jgi:hypothetical protein
VTPAPAAQAPATPAASAATSPMIAQLQEQLNAGQAQEVSRQVARLLAMKGDAAQQYDRYDLLMLRGEAALRMKQNSVAMQSFAEAQKETTDDQKKAIARGTEILVRKSKQTGYTPRVGVRPAPGEKPAGPMPIIEEADRKAALEALLADEMTAVQPKLNAAKNATALPPLADAAKLLGDVRAIEIAGTGASEKAQSLGADIGGKAHGMINDALRNMEDRVEEIWTSASKQSNAYGQLVASQGMMGMTSIEANDLKGIMQTCEKLMPTAADFAAATGSAELKSDSTRAQELHARAKEVAEYDYANGRRRLTAQPKNPNNPPIQNVPGGGGNVTIGR